MPIREEKLRIALSTIQRDEKGGYFNSSKFLNLFAKTNTSPTQKELPPISAYTRHIFFHLYIIETITTRLEWQNILRSKNQLTQDRWESFAGCDIKLFYIEIRSIFDCISTIVQKVSVNLPANRKKHPYSFTRLINYLAPEIKDDKGRYVKNVKAVRNAKILGDDLADFVLSAVDWFTDIRKMRDELLHHGKLCLVFSDEKRIPFQIPSRYENLVSFHEVVYDSLVDFKLHSVSIPEVMYNDNLVDFASNAGMYFGYLIAYLEDLATLLEKNLPKIKSSSTGNAIHPYGELPAIYEWIERLLSSKPEPQVPKAEDAKT